MKRPRSKALAKRAAAKPPPRRPAVAPPPAIRAAPGPIQAARAPRDALPSEVLSTRELFWHNVIREILTSLSMLASLRPSPDQTQSEPGLVAPPADGSPQFDPALFDGRLAVMTKSGERVAIADVFPLFACGINTPGERALSLAVECTVFQIRTPGGQVYTLPLHEIRSFHALTPELMQRLERVGRRRRPADDDGDQQQPFGFAAFTSLVQPGPAPLEPAPDYPLE